jgi:Asp-tRNA(Asn)/Glu-tRNA(Gln) amidotransferase A subunit family amidase
VETSPATLPIGVQLLGRPFEDERLLELGRVLEEGLA